MVCQPSWLTSFSAILDAGFDVLGLGVDLKGWTFSMFPFVADLVAT
jgi:hypothetical protein